jgi:hypothetical protein
MFASQSGLLPRQFGLLLAAWALALPGCSYLTADDLPRQPVAGTVLVDGRPLPSGTIMFLPQDVQTESHIIAVGDSITNGRFVIPRSNGLVPGKYKISVSSEKVEQHEKRSKDHGVHLDIVRPHQEKIPARFNTKSELEIEVKEGGIKHLKLELSST